MPARAGLVPFAAFRDDGGSRHGGDGWDDFLRGLRGQAKGFTLDRQQGQRVRLWVLCEAARMAPMLARAADPYGVPVLSSGGFDSLTAKHDLARELARVAQAGQRAEVLHIGDLDASGVHLFTELAEDVGAMCYGLDADSAPPFTRLAVTPAQAEARDLPSAPPKPTDRRAFTGETVQANAKPSAPPVAASAAGPRPARARPAATRANPASAAASFTGAVHRRADTRRHRAYPRRPAPPLGQGAGQVSFRIDRQSGT